MENNELQQLAKIGQIADEIAEVAKSLNMTVDSIMSENGLLIALAKKKFFKLSPSNTVLAGTIMDKESKATQ